MKQLFSRVSFPQAFVGIGGGLHQPRKERTTMNMKRMFRVATLTLVLSSAPISLFAQEPKQEPKIEKPKLLAVLFYADWCNSCKVLEPKLNQVKREFQGKPILFTRFDMTDEFTKDQSANYAALVGLENFYRENDGKTGFVLLIDTESKKLLGRITKEKTPEEIRTALTHALKGN